MLLFAGTVISVFSADRLYSMSLAAENGTRPVERGIALINTAIHLDPLDARLYSQKYQLMGLITQDAITQQRNNATTPSAQRPTPPVIPSEAEGHPQRVIPSEAEGRVEGSINSPSIIRERQLQLAATCVNLAPSVAANHFRYASAMITLTPHLTRMAKQYLVSQLQKASFLKPYSDSYRKIYKKYRGIWGSSS